MTGSQDPCEPIRRQAAKFPDVTEGTSCNQSSYKSGKTAFLYLGPGPKGKGFKAMFKLERSMPRARELAGEDPDRFQVGSTSWVTTRFTAEKPLPKSIWTGWLQESYELATGSGPKSTKKKAAKKRVAKKKPAKRKATGNG